MSLLYKRSGSPVWYVKGLRVSTKTTNRKLAEEFARKAVQAEWRAEVLGDKRWTWPELVESWTQFKDGKVSLANDLAVIDAASTVFTDRPLVDIGSEDFRRLGTSLRKTREPATVNRHLAVVRAMFKLAQKRGWLTAIPNVERYTVPRREVRWVTLEQFTKIADHLEPDIKDLCTVAIYTGMRYSNCAGLRWEWISKGFDLVTVPAVHTKTARTYTVPVPAKIAELLQARAGNGSEFVFPEIADTVGAHQRVWRNWARACEFAGVPHVKLHALRHSWASLHVKNGTPDRILAQMGGWSSPNMLQVYAHLTTDHLKSYANAIEGAAK